jgi:hypothetical protein
MYDELDAFKSYGTSPMKSGPECLRLSFQKLRTWEGLMVANSRLIWHSMLEVEYHESSLGSAPWG